MADPVLLAAADDGLSYERAAVAARLHDSRCVPPPLVRVTTALA